MIDVGEGSQGEGKEGKSKVIKGNGGWGRQEEGNMSKAII